ncbi:MAG: FtsX-like permease family protein [Acetivibrionales bacterium]|nr:ABC transporter permease [Clostridiaceae bacterium]
MLKIVLRRMFSNPWLIICLLLGSIMATALVSCIPIYTDGILQRMLTKDMENYQLETGNFPGQYMVRATFNYYNEPEERISNQRYFDREIMTKRIHEFGLPIISASHHVVMGSLNFPLVPADKYDHRSEMVFARLGALSDLENHITITKGRMYSDQITDGVIEVIVSQQAMVIQDLLLDNVYTLLDPTKDYKEVCKVRVVGIFEMKDPGDVYWLHGFSKHNKEFMMDYKLFNDEFIRPRNAPITEAEWNCAYDYHAITLQNLAHITKTYEEHEMWYSKYKVNIEFNMPINRILARYNERAIQLQNMLWVLTVPVLIMLTFYIFMVSQLIIDHDQNEIAVFKSRGAGKSQIFLSYLLESSIIAGLAFLTGPFLGMFICRFLGSSNGFLEFVQRTALPVRLSPKVYLYSLCAVLFLIITMLAPVISVSRKTIVSHKQEKARSKKAPVWKKMGLDIILLAVAGYGIYRYRQQQEVLETTGVSANELQIDPLLFLTSTVFILGAGLLFIRLYPYLIRAIYWIGRKSWTPVPYISLIQVGRSRGQEQFLMLFMILAISIGLFNANTARTINKNMEDKIRYSIGADVRLQAVWKTNQRTTPPGQQPPMAETQSQEPLRYFEPNFNDYANLSGAELVTKVLNVEDGTMQTTMGWANGINIMGIIPDQFAKVAWFRPDLLPHHWYEYLNLMSEAPTAFLVSSNLKEKYRLEAGDTVYITWGDQSYLEGTIFAFVDYWPSFNPRASKRVKDEPGLVVANLSYIQNKMALQPYEVWIKKADGVSDKQINDDIINKDLELLFIDYTDQELVKMKNDALLQGMNGMLTLGFIASMLISLLGFLIYWIISIQNRTLQFGILRAMGMSLAKVIGMLACEQLLVSGAAIVLGVIVGGMTGDMFIPLLQIMYSAADQVPPFRIMAYGEDYIKVYIVIGIMITLGFMTLWRIISKIRIDQAVKLGED